MYTILCYSYGEAVKKARAFIEDTDYTICKKPGVLDNVGCVPWSDEMYRRVPGGCCGEVPCILIEDIDYNTIARIGYWHGECSEEACGA